MENERGYEMKQKKMLIVCSAQIVIIIRLKCALSEAGEQNNNSHTNI